MTLWTVTSVSNILFVTIWSFAHSHITGFMRNTTGVTCGPGTAYSAVAPALTPDFYLGSCWSILYNGLYITICSYVRFFCFYSFDLRFLIASMLTSNFSSFSYRSKVNNMTKYASEQFFLSANKFSRLARQKQFVDRYVSKQISP